MFFSIEDAHGQLIIAENALEVKVNDTLQVTLPQTDIIDFFLEGAFLSSQPRYIKIEQALMNIG